MASLSAAALGDPASHQLGLQTQDAPATEKCPPENGVVCYTDEFSPLHGNQMLPEEFRKNSYVYAKVGWHCLRDTGPRLILQAKTQKLEGVTTFSTTLQPCSAQTPVFVPSLKYSCCSTGLCESHQCSENKKDKKRKGKKKKKQE